MEVYLNPEVFSDALIRKILKEIFAMQEVQEVVQKNTPPEEPEPVGELASPEET